MLNSWKENIAFWVGNFSSRNSVENLQQDELWKYNTRTSSLGIHMAIDFQFKSQLLSYFYIFFTRGFCEKLFSREHFLTQWRFCKENRFSSRFENENPVRVKFGDEREPALFVFLRKFLELEKVRDVKFIFSYKGWECRNFLIYDFVWHVLWAASRDLKIFSARKSIFPTKIQSERRCTFSFIFEFYSETWS